MFDSIPPRSGGIDFYRRTRNVGFVLLSQLFDLDELTNVNCLRKNLA